jgi:hypothetical protein
MNPVNRDFKQQLAQAFGLGSETEVDTLVANLRDGNAVDVELLRKGCLALIDNVQEERAAQTTGDQRLKIALQASDVGLWDWEITTDNLFVDRTSRRSGGLHRGHTRRAARQSAFVPGPAPHATRRWSLGVVGNLRECYAA